MVGVSRIMVFGLVAIHRNSTAERIPTDLNFQSPHDDDSTGWIMSRRELS
jgi:hypothetical protein